MTTAVRADLAVLHRLLWWQRGEQLFKFGLREREEKQALEKMRERELGASIRVKGDRLL